MAYGTVNADLMTTSDGVSSSGLYGFKNRIINGAMVISQRNGTSSVTVTNTSATTYSMDRFYTYGTVASKFSFQQNAGSVTPPTGFINYLGCTSLSAYSVGASDNFLFGQYIEGFNVADLDFGKATAKTVTLSFWARSSLTGTFGGSLINSASNRSFVFTYTISTANTWEYKTITIAGDTSGTWLTDNNTGIAVNFSIGSGSTFSTTAGSWVAGNFLNATGATSVVGTNGATFYITGVQLEKGSTATSFDYRPYGTELNLCQRYYWKITATGYYPCIGLARGTTITRNMIAFPVPMRIVPTSLSTTGTASNYSLVGNVVVTCSAVPTLNDSTTTGGVIGCTVSSGLTDGYPYLLNNNASPDSYLAWSAEL